jgi:hypothetical protein
MKNNPERNKERAKAWVKNNPERAKANRALYYQNNKERAKEVRAKWRLDNPDAHKKHQRFYKYGITKEQYEQRVSEQKGLCAICSAAPAILHIDHDHSCCPTLPSCGECVRGLLCGNCNKALGLMKENVVAIENMIKYLRGEITYG